MKNVVLTDKAKDLKKRVMALPDQIRCSMRMNDDELETLKTLPNASRRFVITLRWVEPTEVMCRYR